MEILGVGPTEFIFIVIIALIVLGPKDLAKTGRAIGKWLNNIARSDTWKVMRKTSDELRRLPTQLMRDDNLERFLEEKKEPPAAAGSDAGTWSGRVGTGLASVKPGEAPDPGTGNTIQPPILADGPPAVELKAEKPKAAPRRAKASPAKKTEKKTTSSRSTRKPAGEPRPSQREK